MPLKLENYIDTVNYLYGLQKHGIKLGLENPVQLMAVLKEPEKAFRSIHVAGTNGKGSTSKIIASILRETGLKVGLYTSPHLVSFTERIKINDSPIPESEVARLTSFIREVISDSNIKPTFFEFVTAMAFYYFASQKIDYAVVEVGMGGRLDATNVIVPEINVVTNIGLEHTEFLGETISAIAFEKAGIIKSSVPVVAGVTNTEALKVLKKTADESGSDMHILGKDFKGALVSMDNTHIIFNYSDMIPCADNHYRTYSNLFLPTSGKYQVNNASLAIRACGLLEQRGLTISDDAVKNGLLNSVFEGRLEQISHTPRIIIDSAHNPDAARALSETIKELFPSEKIILIAGIMKDKDIKGILKPLAEVSDIIILTKPKGERAASPEKLRETLRTLEKRSNGNFISDSIVVTNTVAEAIELAKTLLTSNSIIVITGSFYTTGEAKELLGHTGVLSQLRE